MPFGLKKKENHNNYGTCFKLEKDLSEKNF